MNEFDTSLLTLICRSKNESKFYITDSKIIMLEIMSAQNIHLIKRNNEMHGQHVHKNMV